MSLLHSAPVFRRPCTLGNNGDTVQCVEINSEKCQYFQMPTFSKPFFFHYIQYVTIVEISFED